MRSGYVLIGPGYFGMGPGYASMGPGYFQMRSGYASVGPGYAPGAGVWLCAKVKNEFCQTTDSVVHTSKGMASQQNFAILLRTNGTHEVIPFPDANNLGPVINADYIWALPVMPFCFKSGLIKDNYCLIMDEEGLLKPGFKSNAIASLLHNPYEPNKLVGAALLCLQGEEDFVGFSRKDAEKFMKKHPIFTESWEVEEGFIRQSEEIGM